MKILSGHLSPETGYLVNDYPYGFRLRCKIRYWLDYHKRHGVRLMSQTTNPKHGHIWNKPKGSTYARFGGAMYLDEQGHVQWTGLSEYCTGAEGKAWLDKYGEAMHPNSRELATRFVNAKLAYDEKRASEAGDRPTHTLNLGVGLTEARNAFIAPISKEGE